MVSAINQLQPFELTTQTSKQEKRLSGNETFTYALEAAKQLISDNLASEKKTENLTIDFLTGEDDNIHNLMIAQEESSILLQYTLQLRSKVLEVYKEIMSISV